MSLFSQGEESSSFRSTGTESSFLTCFYKGFPYKYYFPNADDTVGLSGYWNNSEYVRAPLSEIEICENDPAAIAAKYVENCRTILKESLMGWTAEKAKELEDKGCEFLQQSINSLIARCPKHVFDECAKGHVGARMCIQDWLLLPKNLQMGDRLCSDGKARPNMSDYVQYLLLGADCFEDNASCENYVLKKFEEALPMFVYKFDTCNKDATNGKRDIPVPKERELERFPNGKRDMLCLLPFYVEEGLMVPPLL